MWMVISNSLSLPYIRLEIQLDDANTVFRSLLSDSTHHLKSLSKKLGSCIEKARPYYEAVDQMTRAQAECQKAAVQFQRSAGIHAAAKETISLAEERFLDNSGEWQFDNAWQEMLNHATIKVIMLVILGFWLCWSSCHLSYSFISYQGYGC